MPKLFRADPISFFVIVGAIFCQARFPLQSTTADYLVANLDHDLIPNIKHLIELELKPIDIYTQIKRRVIVSSSVFAGTHLRRLLTREVISEGKPSVLLTWLLALNHESCIDNIIKSVFLEQMPPHIWAILAMANVDDLQELANLSNSNSLTSRPSKFSKLPT